MVAKRIAAVFAALLLIVGAIVLRNQITGDDSPSVSGADTSTPQSSGDDEQATVSCISDLADLCRGIDDQRDDVTIQIEDWSVTAKAFADGSGPDGWITVGALASLAKFETIETASSTLIIAVARNERAEALKAACGSTPLWACVGDASGEPWSEIGGQAGWGKVLPGFADPSTSAFGAVTFAHANAGFFASTELGAAAEDFASVDIEISDDHADWFRRVTNSVPNAALSDPLALLVQRASAVNVVAATSAQLSALPSSRTAELTVLDDQPVGRIDAVVTGNTDRFDVRALTDALATSLAGVGWTEPVTGPDGVPSAQTVVLLRNNWQGARS